MNYRYSAFGLDIASELPLPELAAVAAPGAAKPDLLIRLDRVPAPLESTGVSAAGPDDVTFATDEVGRYRILNGSEIVVDPYPGASERELRLYLLGSVMGLLCHQRGLLPLHANAIVSNGQAIAFAGTTGSGKSTLAAYFQSRGYQVLCDDVCAVSFDADDRPIAWPGLPRIRLWRDAASQFGYDCKYLERAADDMEKYSVPLEVRSPQVPFPLTRVYVLSDRTPNLAAEFDRLRGASAVRAMMENVYRAEYLRTMGLVKANFEKVAQMARQTAIYAAPRLRGFDHFDRESELLERHFQTAQKAGSGGLSAPSSKELRL